MKIQDRKLIKKAIPYDKSMNVLFSSIYIITGKKYTGFWGKSGYKRIIVLGYSNEKIYYINHNYQSDVLEIQNNCGGNLRFENSCGSDILHLWVVDYYKLKVKLIQSDLVLEVVRVD